MKRSIVPVHHYQKGSANLLIALVLSMSITLVTLAVAKTQLTERRISTNSNWHTRLSLEARSQWDDTTNYLIDNFYSLNWVPGPGNTGLINQHPFMLSDSDTQSISTLLRPNSFSRFFDVLSIATRNDGSNLTSSYNQTVRALTLLAPGAESPPPLILNGCLTSISPASHIRPLNADADAPGQAVWLTGTQPCLALTRMDLHGGAISNINLRTSLWSAVFSVNIEEYTTMAQAEQNLPAAERHYWLASPADLLDNRWTKSLGNATHPVALYFPPEVGCPGFSPNVRIFGIVFIDSSCPEPVADKHLEIFGSLIVNGDLNAGNVVLQLNHIQLAENQVMLLNFPILRTVKIPGTWRDF